MIINYVPVKAVGVPGDAEHFPLIMYVLNLDPHLKFSPLSNWNYLRQVQSDVRVTAVFGSVTFQRSVSLTEQLFPTEESYG